MSESDYDPQRLMREAQEEKQAAQDIMDQALKEFFANGGEIQKVELGKSGHVEGAAPNGWGRRKPAPK